MDGAGRKAALQAEIEAQKKTIERLKDKTWGVALHEDDWGCPINKESCISCPSMLVMQLNRGLFPTIPTTLLLTPTASMLVGLSPGHRTKLLKPAAGGQRF